MESLCVDLLILGMVEGSTGGFDAAIAALEEARQIGASLEGRSQEIDAHSRLALVHLNRGDVRAAKTAAKAAVKRAGSAASPLDLGTAHLAAGYVAMADGNPRDAFASYTEARRHYTIAGSDVLAREARAGTAAAQSALGHHPAAVAAIEALLPTLQTAGAEGCLRPPAMLAHVWQVLRDAGDPRAAAALRRARRYVSRTAERIGDEEMAAGFLALPTNRLLLGD